MTDRLLTRYLTGECTADERLRVERWAAQDPAHRAQLDTLRALWEAAEKPARSWDVEAAWRRTAQRFDARQRRKAVRERPPRRRTRGARPSSLRKRHPRWARIAPVMVVLLALASVYWLQQPAASNKSPSDGTTTREVATARGERTRLQLADGTVVHLNADSKLQYPASFEADQRRVSLRGEAYFEVASDATRPFIVATAQATAQVLGTAFTVEAYNDAAGTQVAVREGRVAVAPIPYAPTPRASAHPDSVVVTAGQVGGVDAAGRLTRTRPETIHPYFGWLDGQLVFREEPLRDVARRLERWYDVDVRIADPGVAPRRLTATFEREALDDALDALALALQVRYERAGRTITFHADPQTGATHH